MYRLLHNSQESIISYMKNNPSELPDLGYNENDSINEIVYDPASSSFSVLNHTVIPSELSEAMIANTQARIPGTQDYSFVTSQVDSTTGETVKYLYSMTELDDGRFLISVMGDTYRQQFSKSLMNGVVMINVLFVSALFVLLMLWVGTLIIPLNQIKSYIQKIRNDEPATLKVKRNDEIGEVADALVDMETELSQEQREKQEMIQNISHDLKTPIATIKSYSEAIKDGVYPYETLEKSVDVIIEHADRLEKKVKSLIMLNKMDYLEDQAPAGENLAMNPVIDKVLLSLKVIRPEIEFERDTDEDVYFHGEEDPWRITIENLIDNALRYAKSKITIVLHQDELKVINDGKLIDEDRLSSLFHPYEKGTDGQFGLGLSIVYKVCQVYGYRVQAENLTEGVCFHIWKDGKHRRNKRRVRKEA
ncbi:MAG: HAMP domain-containing histidine kinase [Solobacterium sp.]|nr:HAMP domain-containing histidine kinase [Solobacterium sp.]MCH4226690.1 HAMP domain-containing histidine kinase [Solobacterium sp.]MCH4281981.1 HAMP domain-containing histidine kinase [Solobacterium sp.]